MPNALRPIILAAGQGTRLRSISASKPLTPVAGRLLIERVIAGLAQAGLGRPLVITGYRGDDVGAAAAAAGAELVHNPDWAAPNGVSVCAAAALLAEGPALLVMGDHLAEPSLYRAVADAEMPADGLVLGIDRRLGHAWVDEEDVTRVATRDGRITAIGKAVHCYDAYDVGVFKVSRALTDALAKLPAPGLSDGVRILAAQGKAMVVDVSAHGWIDIDDPRALALAEGWVAG